MVKSKSFSPQQSSISFLEMFLVLAMIGLIITLFVHYFHVAENNWKKQEAAAKIGKNNKGRASTKVKI